MKSVALLSSVLALLLANASWAGMTPKTQPVEDAKARPNMWIAFTPAFHGAPNGGRYIAVGWNKMVYDSQGKRAIIMDRWRDSVRDSTIYANAVVAIDPAASRGDVLKLTNHKRLDVAGGGYRTTTMPEDQADPTPVDRHPYGCLVYCDADNSIYLGPGANRTAKPAHPQDFWRLDLATRKWRQIGDASAIGGSGGLERVMCYDPANKAIVFYKSAGPGSTWLFDVARQQWRQPKPVTEPKGGMGAAMEYDSKRQVIYLFGGPGSKGKEWNSPGPELWRYSVKDNEWKPLADSPIPARAPALAYDSAHDVLLANIAREGKPNAILFYHPADDRWTELSKPDDGGVWPTGTWDTLCYDIAKDVFVLKSGGYDTLAWLVMRYEPAAKKKAE